MVDTPIYDGLVGELGNALAEVRAPFSLQNVDATVEGATPDQSHNSDQPEAAAA